MNKKSLREFLLYVLVGGIATLTEWTVFFLLEKWQLYYLLATVVAYLLSTLVNWWAGRLLVFGKSHKSLLREILEVYLVSLGGLLLNLAIMWVAVELFAAREMVAKVLATALVFFYNFLLRKLCIYK